MRLPAFLLALAVATPALAKPVTIETSLPACIAIADFHKLIQLNEQDKATAARFMQEKYQSGDCGRLKAGKGWIMKTMIYRGEDYACIRPDGEFECLWTLNLGIGQP